MLDKFFRTIEKIVPAKYQWVLNHDGFKRYFANTGWMFFGQMFSLLVSFFVGAYVARYLGPSNFGAMSYAISFVGLFGFLVGFGVDGILNRELVRLPEERDEILGTSFWMKFSGAILAIFIINIGSLISSNDFLVKILIFLFSLSLIFQSFGVVSNLFHSMVLAERVVKIQTIVVIFSLILKLIFIYLGLGVIWITAVYLFDSIGLAIGLIIIYKKKEKLFFRPKINKKIAISLFKDSFPIMLSVIAIAIYSKIDQVIIKNMLDEASVGVYAVAVKISEIWYFVPGLITTSILPAVINAKKVDSLSYKKRLRTLYSFLLFSGLLISLGIFLLSDPIINLIFGDDYLLSIKISKIYSWSGVFVFLMTGFWTYLLSENRTKIYLIANIIGACSNIFLNIILIPRYGVIGSAYATVISYVLLPFSLILFRSSRGQILLIFGLLSKKKI